MPSDTFWTTPQGTYESRHRAFLEFAAAAEPSSGRTGFFSQLARLELDRGPVDEASIRGALDFVDARHDSAETT